MQYEIRCVRYGEEGELLKDGYEPFGVSSHDTSYTYFDTRLRTRDIHHRTIDYIYLRKKVK